MTSRRSERGLSRPIAALEVVDVTSLRDPLARSLRWDEGVRSVFAGLRVTFPKGVLPTGKIAAYSLGPGRLAGIRGGAQKVVRRPANDRTTGLFNVLLQLEGTCAIRHAGASSTLGAGDLCLLDGAGAFELTFVGEFNQLLVQFPRDIVFRRYERLGLRAGERLEGTSPATRLVFETFASVAKSVEHLNAEGRTLAFEACLCILGTLQASVPDHSSMFSRVAAEIEAELSDPDLSAETLAKRHGVTRRRLDQIFSEHGTTVAGFLRDRRLERVASALRDPNLRYRKVIDLALSHGFNDAAHFSHAFRKRFETSPRTWRANLEE
jgi:AraC-like DNA-binding protein